MPEIQTSDSSDLSPEDLGLIPSEELEEQENDVEDFVDDIGDDEEDGFDPEDEARPVVKRAPARRPRARRPSNGSVAKPKSPFQELTRQEDKEIADWVQGLGLEASVDFVLKRKSPPKWDGMDIQGTIATFDYPITEEEIEKAYGGGKYQLVIFKPTAKGGKQYVTAKTFSVPGDPKIDAHHGAADRQRANAPIAMPMDDGLSGQAMNVLTEMNRELRQEVRSNKGTDWQMVQTIIEPLKMQLESRDRQISDLTRQLNELLGKPADRSQEDRLLSIMEKSEVKHGNDIATIRAGYESELNQLRAFNREELKRREDRFEREIDSIRKATDRELDTLKMVQQQALDSQRHGYENRISGLQDTIKRLESDLAASKVELAELRGRKELSPVDQIQGIVNLKNALDGFNPSSSDEAEKTGWGKILEIVAPIAEGVGSRIADGATSGFAQPQPPAPSGEATVSVRAPDGSVQQLPADQMVEVRGADGQTRQITAAQLAEFQRQAASRPPAAAKPDLDPAEIKQGIQLITLAYQGGTRPRELGMTVSTKFPHIVKYVRKRGVDGVMADVAKWTDGNPITATIAGRAYVREVVQFLAGQGTEGAHEHPDPPPPHSPVESP